MGRVRESVGMGMRMNLPYYTNRSKGTTGALLAPPKPPPDAMATIGRANKNINKEAPVVSSRRIRLVLNKRAAPKRFQNFHLGV